MGAIQKRLQKHKEAKAEINKLYGARDQVLIIHYSCESIFFPTENRSPRITSIAVRFPMSTQTKSFSIHKTSELENLTLEQVVPNYDVLEKKMLKSFYQFVTEHKGCKWIHWKMNDINFGFESIAHRYKSLGGKPVEIKDDKTYDLSILLIRKYGNNYIGNPRMKKLLELNGISDLSFMDGGQEAESFENKEYLKLHQSTLRKVAVIDQLFQLTAEEALVTNNKLFDKYGMSASGIYEAIREDWRLNLLYSLFLIILGVVIRHFFFT